MPANSVPLLLLLLAVLVLGAGAAPQPSPGCGGAGPSVPHPGHQHAFSTQVQDPLLGTVSRHYVVHVPTHYNTANDVPVPLLVDFHGWGGTAQDQMKSVPWKSVADKDPEGFIVVTAKGMDDNPAGGWWGSWNCSSDTGPLGKTCDKSNVENHYPCYSSCPLCDPEEACDWTSCYDDVVFTKQLLEEISSQWCVDLSSIHMSGVSNGGMYIYSKLVSQLADTVASFGPVSGSPLLGFNDPPPVPVNIIDFHGINDGTVPYMSVGPNDVGPHSTVKSWDGFFYHQKPILLAELRDWMSCSPTPSPYPTPQDGVSGWECRLWAGCRGGKEVVACTGDHDHDYPFNTDYEAGLAIMWQFMKSHPMA